MPETKEVELLAELIHRESGSVEPLERASVGEKDLAYFVAETVIKAGYRRPSASPEIKLDEKERVELTARLYATFLKAHCSWDLAREDIRRVVDYFCDRFATEQTKGK